MALIHTIALVNERSLNGTVSSTRTSASRRYTACVVATATAEAVRLDQAWRAAEQAALAEAQAKLAEAQAQTGLSIEAAEVEHARLVGRWCNRKDGLYATEERLRRERGVTLWAPFPADAAKRDLIARGFVDPFDGTGVGAVVMANQQVAVHSYDLACRPPVALGQQGVVTWCGSVALAQKALGSHGAKYIASLGYSLQVRTDIEVRETSKRS